MIKIKLPDGSLREFAAPVSVSEVAAAIGPGRAKAARDALVTNDQKKD